MEIFVLASDRTTPAFAEGAKGWGTRALGNWTRDCEVSIIVIVAGQVMPRTNVVRGFAFVARRGGGGSPRSVSRTSSPS